MRDYSRKNRMLNMLDCNLNIQLNISVVFHVEAREASDMILFVEN